MPFKHYQQRDTMDCGPTCLQMVARHHGRYFPQHLLRDWCYIDREGVSLAGISEAAERIGFRTIAVKIDYEKMCADAPMPCVVHWNQNHFVVVYRITAKHVWVADPSAGKFKLTRSEFCIGANPRGRPTDNDLSRGGENVQIVNNTAAGDEGLVLLLLEPTPNFYQEDSDMPTIGEGWGTAAFMLDYLRPYTRLIAQLGLGLLVGSMLQLLFPLLTQSLMDVGVANADVPFLYVVLLGQAILFFAQMTVEMLRAWILLHISTRLNIALISDFLLKLLRLPIGFFETKTTGDLMQRIGDHHRIEHFLTGQSLSTLFSLFNIVVFGAMMLYYSPPIFGLVVAANFLYVLWIWFFLAQRKKLDYKRFNLMSQNNGQVMELLGGIQEVKLANAERQKRWEWEQTQIRLFRVSTDGLRLEQMQQVGGTVLQQGKDILITFIAAKAVIDGSLSLGAMLAMQYMVGQLNAPLQQIVGFIRAAQDAKISLERLGEIHHAQDEDTTRTTTGSVALSYQKADLHLKNLSFRYGGPSSPLVLNDLTLTIPQGKTTAIVGASGSGKTTLIKLLLKFYPPTSGDILYDDVSLTQIDSHAWRNECGVVMQDGYIFSDSIARNIALGEDTIDYTRLNEAAHIANIKAFVTDLPLGFQTKIGSDGLGLSGGQRQRLLIARAVYKAPNYVFFDEATSSLDANNERSIVENLATFGVGRTVVVVAHRLSTVRNADQIIVLERGQVVEQGNHHTLAALRGKYYELVKNQLELGA
jgi:ATP-binding cassette, subfamily B, bacterial